MGSNLNVKERVMRREKVGELDQRVGGKLDSRPRIVNILEQKKLKYMNMHDITLHLILSVVSESVLHTKYLLYNANNGNL